MGTANNGFEHKATETGAECMLSAMFCWLSEAPRLWSLLSAGGPSRLSSLDVLAVVSQD